MMLRLCLVSFAIVLSHALYAEESPVELAPYFQPAKEYIGNFGTYRSPLKFDDGSEVKTASDWAKRRAEILRYWHRQMGIWSPAIEKPKIELGEKEMRDSITQHKVSIEVAPKRFVESAYLLVPEGKGPFPAVIVVYYEGETGIGRGKSQHRDFALQLAKRGFVTLSMGNADSYYPSKANCSIQPLSFLAYQAANCRRALANLPYVDGKRIGIVGHSFGGKWAMFAACLDEDFAAAAWSDGGIVFDEKRSNVNYWEPWYLGFDSTLPMQRKAGIPSDSNPRTGAYKQLIDDGHDLHELHALMAPRPFLVSGGAEDPPSRWQALNHAIAVNDLLGIKNRVAMTNRKEHSPNAESNEQIYLFFDWALKGEQLKH